MLLMSCIFVIVHLLDLVLVTLNMRWIMFTKTWLAEPLAVSLIVDFTHMH